MASFWPGGRAGALSLTFDDGMPSHLRVAFPALRERGLRGTFYLNPRGSEDDPNRGLPWREWLEQWRPLHAAGHELGNHSLRHPCSLNINLNWAPGINLRDWTLDRMEADLDEAQRRLMAAFPGQAQTSFAYPCYESDVGHGAARVSYVPLIARRFVAGRARGERANDPLHCDPHHLSSWPVERMNGAALIGLAEEAAAQGCWGILTFHGIHEGHLSVADIDFNQLLDHLARRADTIWVAPVAEIAAYIHGKARS